MENELTDYFIKINRVNQLLAVRYWNLIERSNSPVNGDLSVIRGLLNEILTLPLDKVAPDKTSRWIGFIQGELIRCGLTTIQAERDFSRPLFQEIYTYFNFNQPTISIKEIKHEQ